MSSTGILCNANEFACTISQPRISTAWSDSHQVFSFTVCKVFVSSMVIRASYEFWVVVVPVLNFVSKNHVIKRAIGNMNLR